MLTTGRRLFQAPHSNRFNGVLWWSHPSRKQFRQNIFDKCVNKWQYGEISTNISIVLIYTSFRNYPLSLAEIYHTPTRVLFLTGVTYDTRIPPRIYSEIRSELIAAFHQELFQEFRKLLMQELLSSRIPPETLSRNSCRTTFGNSYRNPTNNATEKNRIFFRNPFKNCS